MTERAALFLLWRASDENLLRLQSLATVGDQLVVLGGAIAPLAEQGIALLPPMSGVAVAVLGADWQACGLELAAVSPEIELMDYPAMVRKVEACSVCYSLG